MSETGKLKLLFLCVILIFCITFSSCSENQEHPKKNTLKSAKVKGKTEIVKKYSGESPKKQLTSKKSEAESVELTKNENIQWVFNLTDGMKIARNEKKPLMVDFYADWCGWCKQMDKVTYSDPEVKELARNFVCVKVNTDKNPEDSRKYKVRGLPTIIFLNYNGGIIKQVIGFRNSDDFIKIMSIITEI